MKPIGIKHTLKLTLIFLICAMGLSRKAKAQLLNLDSNIYNDAAGRTVNSADKNLVILIHGWMNSASVPSGYNAYRDSSNRPELYYLFQALMLKLQSSEWGLTAYRWENDAATGFIQPFEAQFIYGAAVEAARNAATHGAHLGNLINEKTLAEGSVYGQIRQVQFIAHSAGAWVAREAMRILLQKNPYCVCQLTLLDPFIPDAAFGYATGLSTPTMSATRNLAAIERVHRM